MVGCSSLCQAEGLGLSPFKLPLNPPALPGFPLFSVFFAMVWLGSGLKAYLIPTLDLPGKT